MPESFKKVYFSYYKISWIFLISYGIFFASSCSDFNDNPNLFYILLWPHAYTFWFAAIPHAWLGPVTICLKLNYPLFNVGFGKNWGSFILLF